MNHKILLSFQHNKRFRQDAKMKMISYGNCFIRKYSFKKNRVDKMFLLNKWSNIQIRWDFGIKETNQINNHVIVTLPQA